MSDHFERVGLTPDDIISRSFDLPDVTSGQVEAPPKVVVQYRRGRIPVVLLAPLFLALACGGFIVGRATRSDWNNLTDLLKHRGRNRPGPSTEDSRSPEDGVSRPLAGMPAVPRIVPNPDMKKSKGRREEPLALRVPENRVDKAEDRVGERRSDAPGRAKPAYKVRGGTWKIKGDELIQTSLERDADLIFGEPTWSEYDLTFQARSEGGHGFKVFFAYTEPASYRAFSLGNYFNKGHDLAFVMRGRWGRHNGMYRPGPIEFNRWYDISIQVRGPYARCFLDGVMMFEEESVDFLSGRVAFSTWQAVAHFRNVKVTDPRGGVLWEGLPLPTTRTTTEDAPEETQGRSPLAERHKRTQQDPERGASPIAMPPGPVTRPHQRLVQSTVGPAKEEDLVRRRLELRAMRPVPIDQVTEVQRALLHLEMAREIGRARPIRPGSKGDALGAGTVWKGKRTYRQGAYAGKTVTYELHIRERDGHTFKGHKFDNGPGRNRVEVEGWIMGEVVSWIEPHRSSLLHMSGAIVEDVILVDFDGLYVNGMTNVGDGTLARQ